MWACASLSLCVCFVSSVRRHLNWMNIFNRKINMLCVYDGWMMPFIRRIAYGSHILCIHVYIIFYLSSLCLPCVINIGRNRCSVCVCSTSKFEIVLNDFVSLFSMSTKPRIRSLLCVISLSVVPWTNILYLDKLLYGPGSGYNTSLNPNMIALAKNTKNQRSYFNGMSLT